MIAKIIGVSLLCLAPLVMCKYGETWRDALKAYFMIMLFIILIVVGVGLLGL